MAAEIVAPPLYVAAGLLLVSGASKLRRPEAAARALYAAGVPGAREAARALGGAEVAAGALALAAPTPVGAPALAACYGGFAAFLAYLMWRRPEAASCGCAGDRDVPPNAVHLALDLLAVAVGISAWLLDAPGLAGYVAGLGLGAIPVLAGIAATAGVAAVVATELPAALGAYRRPRPHAAAGDGGRRHERADAALAAAGIGAGHASLWPGTTPEDGT